MLTVVDYERIRRAYDVDEKSIRWIEREFGHSYWTIRKALDSPALEPYQLSQAKAAPVLGPYHAQIEQLLSESAKLPRKQRSPVSKTTNASSTAKSSPSANAGRPNALIHSRCRPMPSCCISREVTLNGYGQVTLETNRYSVPADKARKQLTLRAYPFRMEILADNQIIATHLRCYGRKQDILNPLRLTYQSQIIEFRGESFRFRHGLEQHKQHLDAAQNRLVEQPEKSSLTEKTSVTDAAPLIQSADTANNLP